MTTTADGTHFNSCSGEIVLQDCIMKGMGDDCVNIHGKYFRILRRLGTQSVLVSTGAASFGASDVSPQGDQVHIVLRSYKTEATAKVTGHERHGDQAVLHFDRNVPPSIGSGDLIFDSAGISRATIKGCHFPGNRARGVLAHSNVSIEDCIFSGQSEQAVLVDVKPFALEGPVGAQVSIRGNKITDVHRRNPGAAIWIGAHVAGPDKSRKLDPTIVNHDIAIESNDFSDLVGPAFFGGSTTRLNIVDNRLTNVRSPSLVLERVSDVRIEGNVSSPPSAIVMRDAEKVDVSGNKGLHIA
jgi:hypothetical protein